MSPLPQPHAIATFNVLNAEDRPVVAALLSTLPVPREEAVFFNLGGALPEEEPEGRPSRRSRGGG